MTDHTHNCDIIVSTTHEAYWFVLVRCTCSHNLHLFIANQNSHAALLPCVHHSNALSQD